MYYCTYEKKIIWFIKVAKQNLEKYTNSKLCYHKINWVTAKAIYITTLMVNNTGKLKIACNLSIVDKIQWYKR